MTSCAMVCMGIFIALSSNFQTGQGDSIRFAALNNVVGSLVEGQTIIFPEMQVSEGPIDDHFDTPTGVFTARNTMCHFLLFYVEAICPTGSQLKIAMIKNSDDEIMTVEVGDIYNMWFASDTVAINSEDKIKVKVITAINANLCHVGLAKFFVKEESNQTCA